jgi:hypothetical protein
MNVVLVLAYMVEHEKRTEFQALAERFVESKKENRNAFAGLKSRRVFRPEYGGVAGSYVEMWKFKSIKEMERVTGRMMKYKEMMEIHAEFQRQIDHAAFAESVWNVVK